MTRTAAATPRATASGRPGPARPAPAYDRAVWERAVMADDLHTSARLIALILAHHADDQGVIAPGGRQDARLLAQDSGIEGKFVRISLERLERCHFISRPPIETWEDKDLVRPVFLILPNRFRTEPAHTGGPR
ncbi:hypothetical protein E4N62_46715 [Streptomyces sp. MNU76]|uniref:hypothetical protein n=1 Tax=Streptomyces sp. MNU76 TaxID=2560026 RepID=UPI001E525F2B|nr:hypothetical protein [Streptomyces sp. MNU76]MCC9712050.1 hypothetical protein [Streptomyces sp. MNU76]